MLHTLFRGAMLVFAASCAVFCASCGVTPLLYPPVDDKSPAEMFDADACAALLKAGTLQSDDGDIRVVFSEYKGDSASKKDFEECAVRGMATMIDRGDKEKGTVETWLPVVIVPFRQDGALYYYLTLDSLYIMEKTGLNPEYVFMMKPYSYILKAEPKDGGWEVGFVQFATTGLEVRKVTEKTQVDKDGTVLNPPAEILEMLKDPKNYEVVAKLNFLPVNAAEAEPARK